jgi:predicted MFS family arabinose efflux permease
MRGVLGYAGWRWMFLLEGLFTLLIGIASFWMMPVAPSKTKTNFRPNGYITDREAKIIVNRVIRDEPTKVGLLLHIATETDDQGNMHNRQPLTFKMIGKSCMDWHLWPVYLIGVLMWIPVTPVSYYLQLSFRQLGFSTIQANLLAVPYGVLSIINVVLIALISELFDNRSFVGMIQFVVSLFWMIGVNKH